MLHEVHIHLVSNHKLFQECLIGIQEFYFTVEMADEATLEEYSPRKIFINRVDDYHGRHLSKFLASQSIGGDEETESTDEEEKDPPSDGSASETSQNDPKTKDVDNKYIIIGTSKSENLEISEETTIIVDDQDKSHLLKILLSCKYIIYDVSENPSQIPEAEWAINALDGEINIKKENGENIDAINFILISTILTWAQTKPIDLDEPDEPFTEDDYRLRRAHQNYKNHLALEKEVIKIGKKHKKDLKTIVVACGITYGLEENMLGILFKLAWLHEPFLPCLSSADNNVPLLHIADLSNIIYSLMESMPRKRWYIFAVEETITTMKEITKAISTQLGTGKINNIRKDEAFALKDMTDTIYDHMTMNLNMQPDYILENMSLEYAPDENEMNFLENIENIVAEFVHIHGLKPQKIFIHGPPLSGKTFLANKLRRYYQLHYLTRENVLQDFKKEMEEKIQAKTKKEQESQKSGSTTERESEDDDDEESEDEEEIMEIYQSLQESEDANSMLDEDDLIRIFHRKLLSKPCQKQGYVLDGFPETYEQAKKLFSLSDDDEEEEEGEGDEEDDEVPIPVDINKRIMPSYIFNLEADNLLLFKRAAKVSPERNINGRYDEENMKQILKEYRILNEDSSTVMNFFDEVEYYPENTSVMDDERPLLEKAFKKMIGIIGSPTNLGPLEDEEAHMSPEEKALIQQQEEEELKDLLEKERLEKVERRKKMEEWAKTRLSLKLEEERLLEAKTIPIREYLNKEIFPFLKEGLQEIYRVKPNDPVDYLAEYLLTYYVDGKYFPPKDNEIDEDMISSLLHMFKCYEQK
ncbi:adenylate kinase 7-like [Ischnura elegans]|uniref:adenylate kinase 7-like n=1 Tax=Ischnura elegans TaxID=197161 RepID=UPI001ED88F7E|nr:adenylate kinase 7-like [Ischnura elegans]